DVVGAAVGQPADARVALVVVDDRVPGVRRGAAAVADGVVARGNRSAGERAVPQAGRLALPRFDEEVAGVHLGVAADRALDVRGEVKVGHVAADGKAADGLAGDAGVAVSGRVRADDDVAAGVHDARAADEGADDGRDVGVGGAAVAADDSAGRDVGGRAGQA